MLTSSCGSNPLMTATPGPHDAGRLIQVNDPCRAFVVVPAHHAVYSALATLAVASMTGSTGP